MPDGLPLPGCQWHFFVCLVVWSWRTSFTAVASVSSFAEHAMETPVSVLVAVCDVGVWKLIVFRTVSSLCAPKSVSAMLGAALSQLLRKWAGL